MSFLVTLEKMVVILFAVVVGFAAKRLGFCSEDTDRRLTKIVLNLLLPCMILSSVMTGDALPELGAILSLLKVAAIFYGVGFIGLLVFPGLLSRDLQQRGVWRFALLLPNTAFIGYPVVEALFGSGAVFYAVVLNLPFNILNFTVGPLLLGGKGRFSWKMFASPSLITSVISLLIALTRLRTPALLGSMVDFMGDMSVPLALMVLGSILAGMPTKSVLSDLRLWVFSAIRLLIMPVILWAVLRPLGLDSVVMGVAVIEMAMPAAVNGVMLCLEYNGDIQSMAKCVFLSTLLSMVTIPLIASWLL